MANCKGDRMASISIEFATNNVIGNWLVDTAAVDVLFPLTLQLTC